MFIILENDYSAEVTLISNNNSGKTETVMYTPIIDPKPQEQSIQGKEKPATYAQSSNATYSQSSNAPKEVTTVVNIPQTPVNPSEYFTISKKCINNRLL